MILYIILYDIYIHIYIYMYSNIMKLPQQVIGPKHPHKASQSQESSYSTLAQKQRVSCFNLISDSRISSAVMCSPQCW